MSYVRVSFEWLFDNMIKQFKFTDFKKKQKMSLNPAAKQFRVSVLLANAVTSFNTSNASNCFDLEPPIVKE